VPLNKPVRRIAIIGTGVIDASWSAFYLARGFNVVARDPAPHAEEKLRRYVDSAWKDLSRLGLENSDGGQTMRDIEVTQYHMRNLR
jgi:3-hydroxyacyl-CoA dehydrogenase